MSNNNSSEDEDMGVIRCICDYEHDDGFTIQCEKCYVWQHAICVGIEHSNVPENYLCEICNPRALDFGSAKQIQKKNFEENAFKGSKRKSSSTISRRNNTNSLRNKNESLPVGKKRQYTCRKSSRQEDCTKSILQFNLDENLVLNSLGVKNYVDGIFEQWSKRNEVNNGNVLDYEESIFEIQSCPLESYQSLPSKTHVKRLDNELTRTGHQKGCFTTTQFKKGSLLSEVKGIVCLKDEYFEDVSNYYKYLCFPLPFVFFHSSQNLVVDCRKQGNNTRFIRMSCNPNAVLKPFFITESNTDILHLGVFSLTEISQDEEITILWDIDTSKFSQNLFSNKHYKTLQFQSNVKSIIKSISNDFSEEHTHPNISEHLENINSWIKYIKKCSCNKGLDCRYNRFFKISKKIWKDKSSQIPKNSYDNSSLSNSIMDESVYSETTPQQKYLEFEDSTLPSSLCLFPVSLFESKFSEFDKKPKIPMYLRKQGLKKYLIHKYRKTQSMLSTANSNLNVLREDSNISEKLLETEDEALNKSKLVDIPACKADVLEMDKTQKMDFIKKLNTFKADMSFNENKDIKSNTKRPKSKSLSDNSYDLNSQNKITLLEYLAKINANSNSERSSERITSLPEISVREVPEDQDSLKTTILHKQSLSDAKNHTESLGQESVEKTDDQFILHSVPNPKSYTNSIAELSATTHNNHENISQPNNEHQYTELSTVTNKDTLVEVDDKLDFGENEADNTYDKKIDDANENDSQEFTDKNSEKGADSTKGESERDNPKDFLYKNNNTHKRSHSPHSRKEKLTSYSDYYYERDDYHYRRTHHSTSNIRHHSEYKHEQSQYNRDYYNPKYYYEDRERNEARYKTHHTSDYSEHKPYDKYSYKPFRAYYPERKLESRYGYLSHPNREKVARKSSHDNKKLEPIPKNTKNSNGSHKEGKMMSSPLSNSENYNHNKRDSNSEINGYSSYKNGRETNYHPYNKNTRYEEYKTSIKQQRGSDYLKNTTYQ